MIPIELDAGPVTILCGVLPCLFEQEVAGRMPFRNEGENVVVTREGLGRADDDFKGTALHAALQEVFARFPTFDEITLKPD